MAAGTNGIWMLARASGRRGKVVGFGLEYRPIEFVPPMMPPAHLADRISLLSIVTTVFRSEATIVSFIRRAAASAAPLAEAIEILVVDDGSPDRSAEIVRDLADADDRIVLIRLSRNFGHHRALIAGLEHASGDLMLVIDSDLEEEPELVGPLLVRMREERADVAYGVQRLRRGGWWDRVVGGMFYSAFRLLSEVDLPRNVGVVRLMSRRYAQSLLRFRDHNPVFAPLAVLTGYRQVALPFDKHLKGTTTYSALRRISLVVQAITSFSGRPLLIIFWMSLLLSLVSFGYGSYVVIRALTGTVQDGWSSLMAALAFFFSLNALLTGVIGLYVKLIVEEVKDRPRSIVAEVYRTRSAAA